MYSFNIKDVEVLTGIKAHTIRIWEKRYGIADPERTGTNIRTYSINELKKIAAISLLNNYGYKISSIVKMTPQQVIEAIDDFSKKDAVDERTLINLFFCMMDLNPEQFERYIDAYICRYGFNDCLSCIIMPFCKKSDLINFFPSSGNIYGLVIAILRRKISKALATQPKYDDAKQMIIMFLPEDDYNEIDLLCALFLIKQNHLTVMYLGPNVPAKDVLKIAGNYQPVLLYTQCNFRGSFNRKKYFERLSKNFHQYQMVVNSNEEYNSINVPSNITITSSVTAAINYMK